MAWTITPHTTLRFAGYAGVTPVRVVRSREIEGRFLSVRVLLDGPQGSVSVSTSHQAAANGLGLPVLPDETLVMGADELWLVGPRDRPDGRGCMVVVEQVTTLVMHNRSLRGALNAITSFKSTNMGVKLEPGVWLRPWTNVLGLMGGYLRVSGPGTVWVGTQVDITVGPPPGEAQMQTTGGVFPIRADDGMVYVPGNPSLSVYTCDPGVTLHLVKVSGGRQYGPAGPIFPDNPAPIEP